MVFLINVETKSGKKVPIWSKVEQITKQWCQFLSRCDRPSNYYSWTEQTELGNSSVSLVFNAQRKFQYGSLFSYLYMYCTTVNTKKTKTEPAYMKYNLNSGLLVYILYIMAAALQQVRNHPSIIYYLFFIFRKPMKSLKYRYI